MPQVESLIVGMHFRPPAKQIVAFAQVGQPLALQADPENPYSLTGHATKVLVPLEHWSEAQWAELEPFLEGCGTTHEELLGEDEPEGYAGRWVGFIAEKGNAEVQEQIAKALASGALLRVTFGRDMAARPLAIVEWEELDLALAEGGELEGRNEGSQAGFFSEDLLPGGMGAPI